MTIVLVLLAICVAAFAVTVILSRFGEKWSRLPHFVHNYVGGVWAVCGIADFKSAKEGKNRIGKFVAVRDTLVFSDHSVDSLTPFSGEIEWCGKTPYPKTSSSFYPHEENPKLFVAFASEGLMPFNAQVEYFTAPQNPGKFIRRKEKENLQSDFRLRFAAWAKKLELDFGWYKCVFGFASVVMVLALCILSLIATEKRTSEQEVVIHLSAEDGTVREVKTTVRKAHYELLVREEDPNVIKGRVTQVLYVGGGNSRACVQRASGVVDCGFADSSLHTQQGDEAYVRKADLLWWTRSGESNHIDDNWLITKAEAKNLAATGKFRIVE